MRIMDKKNALVDGAKRVQDQATRAVEDITDAAAAVKDSTDVVAGALIVLAMLTCATLLVVVHMNSRLSS